MGLFGGKKDREEIDKFVVKINSADNAAALEALEQKLSMLETKYPTAKLVPVYSALSRKFYDFGSMEKAKYYATKGEVRDVIVLVLRDGKKCDELEDFMRDSGDYSLAGEVAKCYFESKKYGDILKSYDEIYTKSKDVEVLHYALLAALNSGAREDVEKIKKIFEEKLKNTPQYHASMGVYYEFMGKYGEAIKHYEEALKGMDSNELRYRLARSLYFEGDIKGSFKHLLNLPQDDVAVKAMKSLLYAKEGKVNEALGILDHILLDSNSTEALLAKAIIMSEHGIGGYEDYLETVLYSEPYNPIALELYGRVMESRDPEKAREAYEKILSLNPENYRATVGMARLSEGEEKEKHVKKALEINPEYGEAKILMAEIKMEENPEEVISLLDGMNEPRAHYLVGMAFLRLGDMEKAELHARKALDGERENVKYKFLLAQSIFKSSKEEAEELIREVLKAEPENEEAKRILAELIYREHPEEALALIHGMSGYEARWLRVKIYRILDRKDEAKKELDSIIKMGADVETYLALAEVSEKEDAIEILNSILKEHPDNERAKLMLARHILDLNPEKALDVLDGMEGEDADRLRALAYLKLERYDEAYPLFEKCAPREGECAKNLVVCGVKMGKYREVLQWAREVASADESLDNLLLLAEIYEHIDKVEAYEAYRRIVIRFPNHLESWKKMVKYGESTGKISENLEYYDTLYTLTGDYNYLIRKARYLSDKGDYAGLYETYTRILAEHPELEDIEDKRDTLLLQMGRYDDLIQLAAYWISKKGAKAAKGYYLRALAYMNMGRLEDALENIEIATSKSKSSKYRQLKVEILYLMGHYDDAYSVIESLSAKTQDTLLLKARIFRAVKRYEEAEKILHNLERAGVKEASRELGALYVDMGKEEEALRYLEESARNFDDPDIYMLGVEISYRTGNYRKAIWFINGGLKKRKNEERLWVYKVLSLLKMGDYEDALRAVERLIRMEDRDEYQLLRAKVLNSLGRYEEAYGILEELVSKKVGDFYEISPKRELAWCLYRKGDYRRSIRLYRELNDVDMVAANLYALEKYRELLSMEDHTQKVLELKGDASLNMGKVEEAKRYYEQSMKLGNQEAKKKLAGILYQEGNLNEAYTLYSQLNDGESLLRKADILEKLGQFFEAAEACEAYFHTTGNKECGLKAVDLYRRVKRLDDAMRVVENIEDGDDVIKMRARIYYAMGRYQDAITALHHIEGEDFDVFVLLGDIYSTLDQPYRAREYYQKALSIREDKGVYRSLARIYERTGELMKAAELYMKCDDDDSFHRAERILRDLRDVPLLKKLYEARLARTVDIQAMKNLGDIYVDEGDFSRARDIYEVIRDYELSPEVLTRLGMIYINLKNLDEAEHLLNQALEMGGIEDTYLYLGKLYHMRGEYARALEMYQKVNERDELRKDLIMLYLDMNRIKEALELGERIATEINDGESWYLYGLALLRAGNLELALKSMKLAEEKGYGELGTALGMIYFKLGQYERAAKAVEEREDPDSRIISGLAQTRLGDMERARKIFESVENGDSLKYMGDVALIHAFGGRDRFVYPSVRNDSGAIEEARKSYLRSMKMKHEFANEKNLFNNLGIAYMLGGDVAKAAEMFEMAGLDPLNVLSARVLLREKESAESMIEEMMDTYSKDVGYWNSCGVHHALDGRFDEAMECFSKANKQSGSAEEQETVIYNRALLLLKLGMYNSALELLSTIKIEDALLLRTYVFFMLGNYEEAKENIAKYPGEGVGDYLSFLNAYIEEKLGNHESAIRHINRAISRNPNMREYWTLKGMILADMGRYRDAERAFRVALHLKEDESSLTNIAAVLIRMGRYDEAIFHLKSVATPVARFNRGCALAKMGDTREAEREFKIYYREHGDEQALYYIHLSSLMRGEPPVLAREGEGTRKGFNLAELLLSSYNVRVLIKPFIEDGKLRYSVKIKNLSGDTISPFSIRPDLDVTVTMNKVVGPIRPYDEVEVIFKTTKTRKDMVEESGLVPGEHVDIEYSLYARGIGIVEEVKVKNVAKYSLDNVLIEPILFEGFSPWVSEEEIEHLEPGEEVTLRFPLLEDEKLKEIKKWQEKYEEFEPKFVEPDMMQENLKYKVIIRAYPFELELPMVKVDYDTEQASRIIKRERRRMLVKNVSKYTEAIVSVER